MKEHDVISQSVRFYLFYYCNPQQVFNNSKSPFPYSGHFMGENPDSAVCIRILKTESFKNKFENENFRKFTFQMSYQSLSQTVIFAPSVDNDVQILE